MPIDIDESRFPLVLIRNHGASTDAEYETYHARCLALMDRGSRERRPYVAVIDGRDSVPPSPTQRRRMIEWMKQHELSIKHGTAGFALVVSSAIQRGVLTAILWLRPLPVPHTVTTNVDDAIAWARNQLGGAGPRV